MDAVNKMKQQCSRSCCHDWRTVVYNSERL